MAAPYYWLYDGTNTYNLDANIFELDLGTPKRKFKIQNFENTHGGVITGGRYDIREISITRNFRTTSNNTWDSTRNDFLKWFNRANWETMYFYVKFSDESKTLRQACKGSINSSEKYSFIKVSDNMSFSLYCEKPYFENVAASTDTVAITGSVIQSTIIANNGIMEVPAIFSFTPTANETSFSVELANEYGFILEKLYFLAGQKVSFNSGNGNILISDVDVNSSNYLSSGGTFTLQPGNNTVYILCSGAGTFEYTFYERFI